MLLKLYIAIIKKLLFKKHLEL